MYCNQDNKILYIIGNGFDLAHRDESNFKTSYNDFKEFIQKRYNGDGLVALTLDELYGFINNIPNVGSDWSNFEESLSMICYEYVNQLLYSRERPYLKIGTIGDFLEFIQIDLETAFEAWVMNIGINGSPVYNIDKKVERISVSIQVLDEKELHLNSFSHEQNMSNM